MVVERATIHQIARYAVDGRHLGVDDGVAGVLPPDVGTYREASVEHDDVGTEVGCAGLFPT